MSRRTHNRLSSGLMLSGPRVALRPLVENDIGVLASWYEGAEDLRRRLEEAAGTHRLSPVGRGPSLDRSRARALPYGIGQYDAGARADSVVVLLAITHRGDGAPIGLLDYRLGVLEDGWLRFGFVDVEPVRRGLGLDAEAVRLVEEDALKRGLARRFRAGVHRGDGLGLYFWLRLGYRPGRPEDSVIPMVRLVTNPGASGGS